MSQPNAKYLKDISRYIDTIPYGSIQLEVKNMRNKVVELDVSSVETLKYDDNKDAVAGLFQLIRNLMKADYEGTLTCALSFSGGKIKEVAYHNRKKVRYGENRK